MRNGGVWTTVKGKRQDDCVRKSLEKGVCASFAARRPAAATTGHQMSTVPQHPEGLSREELRALLCNSAEAKP